MNQTEHLFTVICAFGCGYAIAYGAKNIPNIVERWGYLLCVVFGLPLAMGLLLFAAMMTDRNSVVITGGLVAGFVFRIIKPNVR